MTSKRSKGYVVYNDPKGRLKVRQHEHGFEYEYNHDTPDAALDAMMEYIATKDSEHFRTRDGVVMKPGDTVYVLGMYDVGPATVQPLDGAVTDYSIMWADVPVCMSYSTKKKANEAWKRCRQ